MSTLLYILVMLFGSSTWLSVTGVWVELPLMVSVYPLPEGWSLPSYLAVIVQLAVIGPILHWLLKKFLPDRYFANTTRQIYVCMGAGTLAALFLALFWDHQTYAFGKVRSTALFVLLFCISLVSCTSSVLYLPYMFRFRSKYITAYFIGMGFSALIPSLLALIQGSGRTVCEPVNRTTPILNITTQSILDSSSTSADISYVQKAVDPNFDVSIFYAFMFVWMCIATVAFFLLNVPSISAGELNITIAKAETKTSPRKKTSSTALRSAADEASESSSLKQQDYSAVTATADTDQEQQSPAVAVQPTETGNVASTTNYVHIFLLALTFWCCALMNGVLPSIQSFACLPYGPTVFYLTAILSNISNPLGCFTLFFFTLKRIMIIVALTVVVTLLSIYILILAASSPRPVFGRTTVGSALCVSVWVVAVAILAYLRAVCGALLRETGNERKLWWCGVFTQAGSFVGSVTMFPLVNVYNLFVSAPICP